jgi:hypothetical protein
MPTGPRRSLRIVLVVAALTLLAACDHYTAKAADAPSMTPAPSPAPAPAVADSCRAPGVATPVAVELARRSDGTCAPLRSVFAYRCDPAEPAVAVVDDGRGVRRFLGGSYAVPVAGLPPQAFAVGVTGFGALYGDPSDPQYLWVQADGATTRWLALPNRNKVSDPVTAHMIGDSILDGGQVPVIDDLSGWTVTVDAVIGRGSDGAVAAAQTVPDVPDVVVVEIGVNDQSATTTAANAQTIVDTLGTARALVWLTAHGPETQVPAINQAIVDAMGRIPNGTVLDWNRLVPLDSLNVDGIHPTDPTVLASVLDPFLQTWADAVRGAGPTACESAIRNAA